MENSVQKDRDGKYIREVKRNVDHTEKKHMSNIGSKQKENKE